MLSLPDNWPEAIIALMFVTGFVLIVIEAIMALVDLDDDV